MAFQHHGLASGRWFTMSLAEQLGNVGSEVVRAVLWRERGNGELAVKAEDRLLELLDLTLADARWSGSRRRELARVREAICSSLVIGEKGTLASWRAYFDRFALLARMGR